METVSPKLARQIEQRLIIAGRDDFVSIAGDGSGSVTGWLNVPWDQNCAGLYWSQVGGAGGVALGAGPTDEVRFGDIDG